jgi:hypothetical protein
LGVTRFGVTRFGVTRFGVTRFGVTRFGVTRFGGDARYMHAWFAKSIAAAGYSSCNAQVRPS